MWSCRSCRNELLSPPKTVAKVTESLWRGPNNDRFMIYMHVAYRKYIHVNNPLTTIQPVILRILYISDKEYLFLLAWHIRFFMLLMSASIVMFNTSINFNVQFTSWCHIYNFCELKCYKISERLQVIWFLEGSSITGTQWNLSYLIFFKCLNKKQFYKFKICIINYFSLCLMIYFL